MSSGSGRAEEVLSRLPDPYKYWAGFQLQAGGGGSYFTALPIMWGPTGSHLKGEGCHSIWTSENCALSMSFQISLVRWQPSPKRIQVGSKTRCHRKALLSRGSATCSQKNSTPPWEGGRRELRPLLSSILLSVSPPFLLRPSLSDLSEVGTSGWGVCGANCSRILCTSSSCPPQHTQGASANWVTTIDHGSTELPGLCRREQ